MGNRASVSGKVYEYDNQFHAQPVAYGCVDLFQMGELCCESSFEIDRHRQWCHEISVVVSGEGAFFIQDQPVPVKAGDVVLNRKDDWHAIVSAEHSRLRFFYLAFLFNARTDARMRIVQEFFQSQPVLTCAADVCHLTEHMQWLLNEFYSKDAFSEHMIEAALIQVLVRAYRLFNPDRKWRGMPVQPLTPNYTVNSTVYRTLKYIDDNAAHIKSVAALTRDLGYSYCYMSHVFKEKTGTTLQGYIHQRKIQKAAEMLRGGLHSITKVAEELGYASVQSFSKAFKREWGCSPRVYARGKGVLEEDGREA